MTSSRDRWLALNHAATIFVSAFLLFQIQPLVSKYILPWFGGAPAVWTTCILFFQSILFAGYAYAHFSNRWLQPKQQALLHLALIILAIALLRVVPGDASKPADSSQPVGDILLLLATSVGLPYFVLSSTGPLIQAWFARSFPGRIPYRLYALSNFGSLLALLSYPFVFERLFNVPQQATIWAWGFIAYALLAGRAAVCLLAGLRGQPQSETAAGAQHGGKKTAPASAAGIAVDATPSQVHPRWWHVALWLVLPMFASIVLLATTNHVCTDVAAIPFLWVVPLALYLLTFIIAFDHSRWYRPVWAALFTALAIYLAALVYYTFYQARIDLFIAGTPGKIAQAVMSDFSSAKNIESPGWDISLPVNLAFNFAAMFGICMLCHGELVRLRPDPKHLTAFYLMIAAGGALGGVAIIFGAPHVFFTFLEFNLSFMLGFVFAVILVLRGIANLVANPKSQVSRQARKRSGKTRPRRWGILALVLTTLLIGGFGFYDLTRYFGASDVGVQARRRNFFGTLTVQERFPKDPRYHLFSLYHGRITHGIQLIDPRRRSLPTAYYDRASGAGRTLDYFKQENGSAGVRVGGVGLGVGTLAAYIGPQDYMRFYEINPAVIEISESGKWFTFLKDAKERGGKYDIELGDGRLTLDRELRQGHPQRFDVLVLDAFSGDSIPAHLLTEEAFETYLAHLGTPEDGGAYGAIAVHITNRYVDLRPVLHGIAKRFELEEAVIETSADKDNGTYAADWIILTKNQDLLRELKPHETPQKNPGAAILWTDAYSNLFDVLR